MSVPVVPLDKLCSMDRKGLPSGDPIAPQLPFVGVENVAPGTGIIDFDSVSRIGNQKARPSFSIIVMFSMQSYDHI